MSKMTLEQVRDEIRSRPYFEDSIAAKWADAIDAELKARGEPVAIVGPEDVIWLKPEACEVDVLLYAAPPAPKIEVTEAMVRHANRVHGEAWIGTGSNALAAMRAALEAALKETP